MVIYNRDPIEDPASQVECCSTFNLEITSFSEDRVFLYAALKFVSLVNLC